MYQKILKRPLDFLFSLVLILLLIPVWIPICIILMVTGEHRVFYRQKRVGLNCKPFFIWKHATMIRNSEFMKGGLYTTRNDPRIMPFGSFLRKTKLDEIPQLFQILIGKMSFVGPRPLVVNNPYPQYMQEKIYKIKPGVTGIGSLIFRDEEKLLTDADTEPELFYANHILPYKASLELWYHENTSLKTDVKIFMSTIFVLLVPNSNLPFMLFNTLPPIPGELHLRIA